MKLSLDKNEMVEVLKKYISNTYNLSGELEVTSEGVTLTIGKTETKPVEEEKSEPKEPNPTTITEMLGIK